MCELTNDQKHAIGLDFVLENLNCNSPYGHEKLRTLSPYCRNNINKLEREFDNIAAAVALIKSNNHLFVQMEENLAHFRNIRGSVKKCENQALGIVEMFEIKGFLLNLERILPIYMQVNKAFTAIDLVQMTEALDVLDPHGKRVAPFFIEDDASEALKQIREEKAAFFSLQKKGEEFKRAKIIAAEDAEEMHILQQMSDKLRQFIPLFVKNMDAVGELDFCMAKAVLAEKFGATRPIISNSPQFVIKGMFNPMVADALVKNGNTFTKINITMQAGTTIITGANMGGKSVALRTAALNAELCRLGFYIFAIGAQIPLFDSICLISEDKQDLHLSSFGAEIKRLDQVVVHSRNKFMLIILDEPARTTNPAEGTAIAQATALFFAKSLNVCLMSTHYDLAGLFDNRIRYYQVAGLTSDATASDIGGCMDYSLVEVDANTPPPRNAMRVCKLMGLDDELMSYIENAVKM